MKLMEAVRFLISLYRPSRNGAVARSLNLSKIHVASMAIESTSLNQLPAEPAGKYSTKLSEQVAVSVLHTLTHRKTMMILTTIWLEAV